MSVDKQVTEVLNMLASTTKRKEKEAILADAIRDIGLFYKVLVLAYNPYIVFGFYDVNVEQEQGRIVDINFDYAIDVIFSAYTSGENNYREVVSKLKNHVSMETWEILTKIFKKDLDCGIGTSTINNTIKANFELPKIPDYKIGKAEELSKLDEMPFPAYGNEKYDGARATSTISAELETVVIKSSSGKELQQVEYFSETMKDVYNLMDLDEETRNLVVEQGFVLDGEFIGFEPDGTVMKRQKINGIFNKMLNGNASEEEVASIHYVVFDFLIGEDAITSGGSPQPLCERVENLEAYFSCVCSEVFRCAGYRLINDTTEAHEFANSIINQGREGAVIKDMNSAYECKRMKAWVKIKATYDVDVEVVGWTPHKKDKTMIGSLEIATSDREITGNIGTGHWLTHERRRELLKLAEDGNLEGMILFVRIMEVTTNKKGFKRFYIPRIEERRIDKNEADSHDKVMSMFVQHG